MQDYILQIICVHVHFLCLHSNTGGCSDKITNLTLISILELENVASMEKKGFVLYIYPSLVGVHVR